jgi:hypothetical protein
MPQARQGRRSGGTKKTLPARKCDGMADEEVRTPGRAAHWIDIRANNSGNLFWECASGLMRAVEARYHPQPVHSPERHRPTPTVAVERVDIIAGHQYHGELSDGLPEALTSGKRVRMTEYSAENKAKNDPVRGQLVTMDGAINLAKRIYTTLTGNAGASAWLWFIYFGGPPSLDESGGLVRHDGTSVVPTKAFWALGNYSKFAASSSVRTSSGPDVGRAPEWPSPAPVIPSCEEKRGEG